MFYFRAKKQVQEAKRTMPQILGYQLPIPPARMDSKSCQQQTLSSKELPRSHWPHGGATDARCPQAGEAGTPKNLGGGLLLSGQARKIICRLLVIRKGLRLLIFKQPT